MSQYSISRKVMVVVDSTREAKRALLWTLSHALLNHDSLILLHVFQLSDSNSKLGISDSPPPNKYEELKRQMKSKDYKVLNSLKSLCKQHRPEVEVEVMVVGGGKEKGPTIVSQAKKLSVSLLVLGQPKLSLLWRLPVMSWGSAGEKKGSGGRGEVVEYFLQNSECMSVVVRKKTKRLGGYLISTKCHKNFWLLA